MALSHHHALGLQHHPAPLDRRGYLAGPRARWFFVAAAVCAAAAVFVTVRLEIAMNHMISSWTPAPRPDGWTAIRDQWLRNQLIPTLVGVGAATWGTAILAAACVPCAITTGLVAVFFFDAATVELIGDVQPDRLLYQAAGLNISQKLP